MRIRAGLVTAIYKKALVLSSDERGRATGDIVNLMSVDATRMQDLCTYGIIAISGPYQACHMPHYAFELVSDWWPFNQITLAFVSLYNLLGWSAFVGVAIMVFSIPLNTFIARILKKMQEQQMKNRDKRTRLMSELLANIKRLVFSPPTLQCMLTTQQASSFMHGNMRSSVVSCTSAMIWSSRCSEKLVSPRR